MNPLIESKRTTPVFLIGLALALFGFSPRAEAVVPPPDGDYGPPLYGDGNTAEGLAALFSLQAGQGNTALGWFSLFADTTGNFNTGVGAGTLALNTGENNTAVGALALINNTIGTDNTAHGVNALASNDTGSQNTANGAFALSSNTVADQNTATGFGALQNNTEGNGNTANGAFALFSNTIAGGNTATGFQALMNNTEGGSNTANGWNALGSNRDGNYNTASGWDALGSNTTGGGNTAFGYGALFTNTTGSLNIALGAFAGKGVTTANGVICIGSLGADVDNSTWIDNIYGVITQSGTTAPVVVSDGGQLGTIASSQRFKKDIATMDKASEMVLSLRPVTFHYKTDAKETPQFGLIAEEVAKVNPALVLPDKDGKPYTVRYEAVNAMLLNEFLKEHRKVEQLEAALRAVNERLAEQGAEIQKVSAELQLSRQAPQTAVNDLQR